MARHRERREQRLQRDRVGCHDGGEAAKSDHALDHKAALPARLSRRQTFQASSAILGPDFA